MTKFVSKPCSSDSRTSLKYRRYVPWSSIVKRLWKINSSDIDLRERTPTYVPAPCFTSRTPVARKVRTASRSEFRPTFNSAHNCDSEGSKSPDLRPCVKIHSRSERTAPSVRDSFIFAGVFPACLSGKVIPPFSLKKLCFLLRIALTNVT